MKKIAILGSNSFSGSSFVNYVLNKNYKVLGISRSKQPKFFFSRYHFNKNIKNFNFKQINLNNIKRIISVLDDFKPEFIINYSAQSMVNESWDYPLDWYATNVMGTISLVEYLKNKKYLKKYIHFSTPEVYGSTKKYIKEGYTFNPSTPYAISRATSDFHINLLNKEFNFSSIITRASNVYGEYQSLYRIIPITIIKILKNEKLHLHGGGKSDRSFIHIDDVNSAIIKILDKGTIGDTYHIATKNKISIYNLVKKISSMMNYDIEDLIVNSKDRLGKDKNYFLNSDKIRDQLKWKDNIKLDKGLKKVINWASVNFSYLKNLKTSYEHKK